MKYTSQRTAARSSHACQELQIRPVICRRQRSDAKLARSVRLRMVSDSVYQLKQVSSDILRLNEYLFMLHILLQLLLMKEKLGLRIHVNAMILSEFYSTKQR